MGLQCHGPIWVIDDLTPCFQRNYLRILFPLIACGLSLLLILFRTLYPRFTEWRRSVYKPLANGRVNPDTVDEDEDSELEEEDVADLILHKSASRISHGDFELNRPPGQLLLVSLELAGLLVEVGVCIAVLVTHAWGRHGNVAAAAKLASWVYILTLTAVRFALSTLDKQIKPRLWNHTTTLYAIQWLLTVFVFRSEIIHPLSRRALILSSIEFAVLTILVFLSITTRRGNKTVLLQHEDGLEPPHQPYASLLSLVTFSWLDPMIWKGYYQPLELDDVWNLTVSRHAGTILHDFRQRYKHYQLLWRLLRYFDKDLIIQAAWTVFSNLFTFIPTLLLKAILEYVEDPRSTPANAVWLYAILLFVSGAIQGIADGQALWIGRNNIGLKLRAIIIGEIYSKALRRKAGATTEAQEDGESKKKKKKSGKEEESPAHMAGLGTIINLMAIDSFKVSEACAYLHFLWASVPTQVIVAIVLLYRVLGFSSFAGIGLMVLILPVNLFIARSFRVIQNEILSKTDARIHSTNEVLQNIRIIKYFAWEHRFKEIVNEKRKEELKALRYRYILWSFAATVWYGTPILITLTTFLLYTVVEKKRLSPSIAFPALSMFSLLRVPLDQLADMIAHVQEAKVSIDRVEKFLDEEETAKYSQLRNHQNSDQPPKIALENATLTWGAKPRSGSQDAAADSFRLIDMDVSFKIGSLNVVAGPTGSGKTSLLMALLGEMRLLTGQVFLPGVTTNRAELPVDPETLLIESIAYCAQEAWLVNDTIKENIVFSSPFDIQRYNAVIKACALERDFQILEAGDETLVGEKGISLSGGQKQRISLARAMYSRARHLLLDDCLSAVDSHTAKHIFREAIRGPLMAHRTCVLVTHNIALTVPEADYVVVMDNGKIATQGSADDVAASGVLGDELLKSRPTSRAGSKAPSILLSEGEDQAEHTNGDTNGKTNGTAKAVPGADAPEGGRPGTKHKESKAVGSVKWTTIKMYLNAMGPWHYWIAGVGVFVAQQFGSAATNIWIRQWANAYDIQQDQPADVGSYAAMSSLKGPSFVAGSVPRTNSWGDFQLLSSFRSAESNNNVDVTYYLSVYALLGLTYVIISMGRELVLFWGSLHASWKIHETLLQSVLHAKFKFFDSTPLGQLMNRFSKDVEAIDQEVAPVTIGMLHSLASVIMIVGIISVITPGFLIAAAIITLTFTAIGAFYLNASRDLKRLESVQRSPLYQQFGETLTGIVTIRAYGDPQRFLIDNHRRIDSYNRPHIYLWASNRWLAFRADMIGALVSFLSAAFVLTNIGQIDAGAAGLSLTYAVTFTENVLWLVRLYAEAQTNMNSVERVREYLEVEQEADKIIEDRRPPSGWPSRGAVKFVDYSTRYRSDLDRVLKNVSFSVRPGEKVGIVGRTGAGKSSLALALFRGLEAETGKIVIDGIDIGNIGLQDLRENITIVPQDPTLFTGTIRSNLDPFGLFSDEQIFVALRRVHLIGQETSGSATPASPINHSVETISGAPGSVIQENKNIFRNLESPVAESGSNLSQGQRQLLCLARALLKNPRVLMMDEATASIDYATDAKIQETLRELEDSTIITIAHRLQTIIDYDKVLVLDHGEVIEFDHPWTLINKENGSFRSMCENSGNTDVLIEGAKKAWESKRLVEMD
ncbi:putative ABC bile acid transporter [Talaromyces proteolyticus]|uniref:ABC bile acid transporter n=1 Tax=Talaromyces proteolyticus TaxID=1131652 RepID=A0AAD4Q110_9EURO|nr:putative ABC bile acid transporter [Talaromyces proteolyticus]KAH8701779.1 putative ABC bile acid transporter [Talaromyces proteolyticus]